MEDGLEKPIAFSSRTLAPAEKNYSKLEKGFAIVYGVKKSHAYLYGRHFTIPSDHQPLQHLFGEKKGVPTMAAAQIQCWVLTLSAYEYQSSIAQGNPPRCGRSEPTPTSLESKSTNTWRATSPLRTPQQSLTIDYQGNCTLECSALTGCKINENGVALKKKRRRFTAVFPPEGRAKCPGYMFLVGIMSSYSQPGQGSSGEKAAWRASRNCLHESPGKELRTVARHLNRAEETRTRLLTVPAVKKRTSISPVTPIGVAKRTLGLPTSRLGRTIPGEDVCGGGRHSYQVVGGSANVIHHSGSNSGEAAAHLCS